MDRPLFNGRNKLVDEEFSALFTAEEPPVFGQVGSPYGLPQGAQPLFRPRPGQRYPAVAGAEGHAGGGHAIVRAHRRLPGSLVVIHVALDVRYHALVHRYIYVLSSSGLASRLQSQDDAQGGPQPGYRVADVVADGLGRAVRVSGHLHPSRHGLDGHVVCRPVGVWPGQTPAVAVAGDAGVNEAGVNIAKAVVAQPQAAKSPGSPVVYQHVRGSRQVLEGLLAAGMAEVDADALLVAVDAEEPRADAISFSVGNEGGAPPGDVAGAGPLNLDYFRSHVGQDQRAERPGDDVRGIQHANALEGQGQPCSLALEELRRVGHGSASQDVD